MKKISIFYAYLIYIVVCISIIITYLLSAVQREESEILKQPTPLLSQFYDLKTVAIIGVGLNLSYYLYTKSSNKTLSVIHITLAIALAIFGIYGIIAVMSPR